MQNALPYQLGWLQNTAAIAVLLIPQIIDPRLKSTLKRIVFVHQLPMLSLDKLNNRFCI